MIIGAAAGYMASVPPYGSDNHRVHGGPRHYPVFCGQEDNGEVELPKPVPIPVDPKVKEAIEREWEMIRQAIRKDAERRAEEQDAEIRAEEPGGRVPRRCILFMW